MRLRLKDFRNFLEDQGLRGLYGEWLAERELTLTERLEHDNSNAN